LAGAMSSRNGKIFSEMIRQDKVHIILYRCQSEEDIMNLVAHNSL
jgi:hypothetical protein